VFFTEIILSLWYLTLASLLGLSPTDESSSLARRIAFHTPFIISFGSMIYIYLIVALQLTSMYNSPIMKKETHPQYNVVTVKCANCDSEFTVGTTSEKGFQVSICSQCHPAYTGKSTMIDSTNRVSRFLERQQKSQGMQKVKSN